MIGAKEGDEIVVADRQHNQHGLIVGVYCADGAPPYMVRWCDDGRETLFMPGPQTQLGSVWQMGVVVDDDCGEGDAAGV